MYKWGWVACLLIALVVGASGCTFLGGGNDNSSKGSIPATIDMPALPDQYVAQPEGTSIPGPGNVTPQESLGDLPVILAAARTTINGTGLAGNTSDSTSSNTSVVIPVGAIQFDRRMRICTPDRAVYGYLTQHAYILDLGLWGRDFLISPEPGPYVLFRGAIYGTVHRSKCWGIELPECHQLCLRVCGGILGCS